MKTVSYVMRLGRTARLAAPTVCLFALAARLEAVPLAYEGFNYPVGTPLPAMAGGLGWVAGWTGSSQMLAVPPIPPNPAAPPATGNSLLNTAPGEAFRPFVAGIANAGSDIWISFEEMSPAAGNNAFVDISSMGGSFPDIQINSVSGGGPVTLNGAPVALSGPPALTDFFLLQLTQFNGADTTVNFYVNPGAALGPPVATYTVPTLFLADQFYYRSDPNEYVDEIRVGTSPADVAAVVTPEPSAFVMLACGALLPWVKRKLEG